MGIETNSAYGYAANYEGSTGISLASRKRKSRSLLVTASAAMLSVALASGANAQTIPAECAVDPSPLTSGSTITCVSVTSIGPIEAAVDDLTVVIGDDTTTTHINSLSGDAVNVRGANGLAVTLGTGSSAISNSGYGISAEVTGGVADLTVAVDGQVVGSSKGIVTAANTAATQINLGSTANVTGKLEEGILSGSTGADATITVQGASGDVYGGTDGMKLTTAGADILVDDIDSVTGNAGNGLNLSTGTGGGDITVDGVDKILGTGGAGIVAVSGTGNISIQGSGLDGGIKGTNGAGIFADAEGDGVINIGGITAIGDVNGGNNHDLFARGQNGVTIDTSAGTITSSLQGIDVRNDNNGVLTIVTADITPTSGIGINAVSTGLGITIDTSQGEVKNGVSAVQSRFDVNGVSGVSITTATVSAGTRARGIKAQSRGGLVNVDSTAGLVTGTTGIEAIGFAGAEVMITTADVIGTTNDGIYGYVSSTGDGNVTIDSSLGMVEGANRGIFAQAKNSGNVSVTVDGVTGDQIGIETQATSGTTEINLGSTAVVTGEAAEGILASSTGAAATITVQGASGDVVGGTDGMKLTTAGADILVQNLDSVTGNAGNGLNLSSVIFDSDRKVIGGADITVTGVDTILGTGGAGILAVAGTGDISIQGSGLDGGIRGTGTGDIRAGSYPFAAAGSGIAVVTGDKYSRGNTINIGGATAIGDVTSDNAFGVFAYSFGDVTIDTSAGTVIGASQGLYVRAVSTSDRAISVTTADVTGTGDYAIHARAEGQITIDTVQGEIDGGIYARQGYLEPYGIAITTAAVDGDDKIGIFASSQGGDTTVDSTAGLVTGTTGIEAQGLGDSSVTVTTAGVTGTSGDGISGFVSRAGKLTIDSSLGKVDGVNRGIFAEALNSGDVSITVDSVTGGNIGIQTKTATGTTEINFGSTAVVTGTTAEGILASSTGAAAAITVQGASGDVVGGTDGMKLTTAGADILVQNLDSVTGQAGDGIDAESGGGSITITGIDKILGTGGNGIVANGGTGNISIQGVGLVGGITGTGSGNFVTDGRTYTNGNGLFAFSSGNINIGDETALGAINSTNAHGIFALATGGNIVVRTGADINAGDIGIRALSRGGGEVDINTTSNIYSDGIGISASSRGLGSVKVTSTGIIKSGGIGIYANDSYDGNVSVYSSSAITTTGDRSDGIYAKDAGDGDANGSVIVDSSGAINTDGSNARGIFAYNAGEGDITVTSSADITAKQNVGIRTENVGYGGITLGIADGAVNGTIGISSFAVRGATEITLGSDASVTGTVAEGILASSADATANITVQGSSGTIVGATDGTKIGTFGADILVRNIDSVTGQAGDGIDAVSSGGSITITSVDTILGTGGNGILALAGSGDISIHGVGTVGGVTGTSRDGIFALTTGEINIGTDSAIGAVVGSGYGIRATSGSGGGIKITTTAVTGESDDGIFAQALDGNITIDSSAGMVSGDRDGIRATSLGTGAISVTVDDVTGRNIGIRTQAATGTTEINLASTADVTGTAAEGILASSTGAAATITVQGASGDVVGGTDGIKLTTIGADILVQNLDSVTGKAGSGLNLQTGTGAGAITVTGVDTILGTGGTGILAAAETGDISIQGSGLVGGITGTGTGKAIQIGNAFFSGVDGAGIIAVTQGAIDIGGTTANGDVTSENGYGIFAQSGGRITIDTSEAVVKGGIIAEQVSADTEGVTVTTAAVSGYGLAGILARSRGGGTSVNSTAGAVSGTTGIFADGFGGSDVLVTTADATGTSQHGIYVRTGYYGSPEDGGDITVDSSLGNVSGAVDGIRAIALHAGDIRVTVDEVTGDAIGISTSATTGTTEINLGSTAVVTGTTAEGILASSTGAAATITVQGASGNVVGGTDGIELTTAGADIVVRNLDSVTGQAGNGLNLSSVVFQNPVAGDFTVIGGGDITVDGVDTILGTGGTGILAVAGDGDISIQGSGLVGGITGTGTGDIETGYDRFRGVAGSGIFAFTQGAIDIGGTSSVGAVVGSSHGIYARTDGDVAVNITTSAVTGNSGDGISAYSYGAGAITINSTGGTVTGSQDGIDAYQYDSGDITITAASVDGGAGRGINAYSLDGTITIDSLAGAVTGGTIGIRARASNESEVSITTADVTGKGSHGIDVRNHDGNATVNTTAGTVSGAVNGINVTQDDDARGDMLIAVANVTGTGGSGIRTLTHAGKTEILLASGAIITGGSGAGIRAENDEPFAGANIAVRGNTSGEVIGATDGMYLRSRSSSNILVSNIDSTTGQNGNGIDALSVDGSITIEDVDTILGTGGNGILAVSGTGDISIQGSGTDGGITGTGSGNVVTALRPFAGVNGSGIVAITEGTINIGGTSAIGDVSSSNASGIYAESTLSDITIDTSAGTVKGATYGIYARSRYLSTGSTGKLTISTGGAVTGTGRSGIRARGTGLDMLIETGAGTVTGGDRGIMARNYGSGDLTIATGGDVVGGNAGIEASNEAGALVITTTGAVTGTVRYGIKANNYGPGDLTIATGGDVTGGDAGIEAFNEAARWSLRPQAL